MLSPEQISQLKATPTPGTVTPSTEMDHQAFENWLKTPSTKTSVTSTETKDLPLMTKNPSSLSGNILAATGDVITGGVKYGLRGARSITEGLQSYGQGVISRATGKPIEEVKSQYGVKSLDESTPEGQFVTEALKPASQAERIGGIIETGGEIAAGLSGGGAETILKQGKNLVTKGKTAITDIIEGTKNLYKGKTEAEILATPESDLHKLSKPERDLYFNTKKADIEAKAKMDLKVKSEASQAEAEALQRELSVATRDKVLELRPKISEAMSRQSQEYRRLVEEELDPYRKIEVGHKEFGRFIDQMSGGDQNIAQSIKDKFGIIDKAVHDPKTTVGKLFDLLQSTKQEISTTAKKGTRVFTPAEKAIDDSINVLNQFLKSKGVDLSEANKFWAKYAPIRNQLVSEAKPFLQTETQTKTFANTLKRVAEGKDVNNENFIKEVENLVGEPINNKTKNIVSKLEQNEKSALADKINVELEKDKVLKKLEGQKFEAERKARVRTIIKRVLYAAGGLGVEKTIKKYTGLPLP